MGRTKKRKAGRPKLEVDMNNVEKLCSWGCTHVEIADWLRISPRTLAYWLADETTTYKVRHPDSPIPLIEELTLRALMERGYSHMRIGIRRMQLKLLEAGSNTMGVWLGKQYLGQTDRLRLEPDKPAENGDVPVTLEELLRRYRKATK